MHEEDHDLEHLYELFAYGEIYNRSLLNDQQREIIALSVLSTNQTLNQLPEHVHAGLNAGLKAEEIQEVIIQCTPYIGFSKALESVNVVNETLKAEGFELPLASQRQSDESDRFEKGLALQHIQDALSAMCFGDFYTRGALDVKTRELITLCVLAALGGCENQLRSHVQGNAAVGNSKELMIEAITVCLIHIGFPRTLNALNCINECLPE